MSVVRLTQPNFKKEVLDYKGVVLVDFYAEWCAPCQAAAPILNDLSTKYPEVKFLKVNVETDEELAQENNVSSLPTFILFKNGVPVYQTSGSQDKSSLEKVVSL